MLFVKWLEDFGVQWKESFQELLGSELLMWYKYVRKKNISGLCHYVSFCELENISKVMFIRAGLENNDFTTFAIILVY
jgi:hypothetical protein